MQDDPVNYQLNPSLPAHALAASPSGVVVLRTLSPAFAYGLDLFGTAALDVRDPVTGNLQLSCLLGDSVSVGTVATSGGIAYAAGRFMGNALEFCDGSQVPGISPVPFTTNHFLLAWDMGSGALLWMRNLTTGHPQMEAVPSLAFDPLGRLWYLYRDFTQGAAVRVDGQGNDVEARTILGFRDLGTLSFDPWGGLYVAGSCENGTLSFGGAEFPVASDGGYNMFVLRFRPDGTAGFAQFATDVTFQAPTVAATGDGRAYLAGGLMAPTQWGGLSFGGPGFGGSVFLAAMDSSGDFLWGKESTPSSGPITGDMQRSKGPCIAVDASERVYLLGTVRGTIDWGGGVITGGGPIQDPHLSVTAFGPGGAPLWGVSSLGATWTTESQTLSTGSGDGVVHFTANVGDTFTLGGIAVGGPGQQAAVVGRISTGAAAIAGPEVHSLLAVHPNPAHDQVSITFNGWPATPLRLLDAAGRCVLQGQLSPGTNWLDVRSLKGGLYVLQAGPLRERVVVQ